MFQYLCRLVVVSQILVIHGSVGHLGGSSIYPIHLFRIERMLVLLVHCVNELAQLEQGIQSFQQKAQESLVTKREELLAPVYTKVGNSIKAVAEENSYDFVLTAGVGGTDIVLFAAEEFDISDLVLKNMGIGTGE